MPEFYKNAHLIRAGLQFLMRSEVIVTQNIGAKDRYQISPQAMARIAAAAENDRITREIDLEIKRRTLENLKWERIPKKFWWVFAVLSGILGIISLIKK